MFIEVVREVPCVMKVLCSLMNMALSEVLLTLCTETSVLSFIRDYRTGFIYKGISSLRC